MCEDISFMTDECIMIQEHLQKYLIIKILECDEYNRTVLFQDNSGEEFLASFLDGVDYNEYQKYELPFLTEKHLRGGDNIIGLLSIVYVINSEISKQSDLDMEWITDVVVMATCKVTEIIDEYTLFARTNIVNHDILIQFEGPVTYQKNDVILVKGELQVQEADVIDI